MEGRDAADILKGGGGSDVLEGVNGDDQMNGNEGSDVLKGGGGSDGLSGDAGNDTLNGGPGDDSLDGGEGFDYVDYSDAPGAVTVDLGPTSPQNTGSAGIDTLINFEGIIGSAFDDILLRGFGASVTLVGSDGNDTFHDHDAGNDTFNGGNGSDMVDYITGGTAIVTVDLAAGTATSAGGSVNTLISIENAGGSTAQTGSTVIARITNC